MCLLIIAGVSAVDTYINIKYGIIAMHEENPLARAILSNSREDLGLLIAMKLMGTALASAILTAGFFIKTNHTLFIAGVVALAQLLILHYMFTA